VLISPIVVDQPDWEGKRLPEKGGGRVDLTNITKDSGSEGDATVGVQVRCHGQLVFGTTVDVIEDSPRQATPRGIPEIGNGDGALEKTLDPTRLG